MKILNQANGITLKIACIIMLLFAACKKEESSSGEVKIQVIEYGSNASIKNAFVGLLKRTSNGVGSSASWEVLKDGKTDSLGYISFGNYNNWSQLYIDVQHPDYYDISTISLDQLNGQQNKIVLAGVSVVGVRFFNTYQKNKPKTFLAYSFDPFGGGGGFHH